MRGRNVAWAIVMAALLATAATAGWFLWRHYAGERQASREAAELQERQAAARQDALPPIDVTPEALEQAFAENEIAATSTYLERVVRMNAVVESVEIASAGGHGVLVVVLRTRQHIPCLVADTPDTRRQLAALKKGQRITVRGVCRRGTGASAKLIAVARCALEGG